MRETLRPHYLDILIVHWREAKLEGRKARKEGMKEGRKEGRKEGM